MPAWLKFQTFEFNVRLPRNKLVFFLIAGLLSAGLGWAGLRTAYVAILGESADLGQLRTAVALDPNDPALQHKFGMMLCESFSEADRQEGLKRIQRATELSPHNAHYWSDLAWVYEMSGDSAGAVHGIEQAVRLSPMTPHTHWVAANTFLRFGRVDQATEQFRVLLNLDPTYAQATFHLCIGTLHNPQLILEKVIPTGKDPRVKLAYLDFLSTNEMIDQAHPVWMSAIKDGTPFPPALAMPYINNLLYYGRVEEAKEAWADMESLGVVTKPPADEAANLVFNGDFERMPLNGGLDWRYSPGRFVTLDFADPDAHTGKSCLRMDFTVSRNDEYIPLSQAIPVSPNQAYVLTAYVRSQDITSDSGPVLHIQGLIPSNAPSVYSESTVGTTPWHAVSLNFCTGPKTTLVELSVVRRRGRTFPTEITGSFWLDSVILKASGASEGAGCDPSNP